MAQWITRSTSNRNIAGSSPAGGEVTTYFKATCNRGDDDRYYDHGVHLRNDSQFYSRIFYPPTRWRLVEWTCRFESCKGVIDYTHQKVQEFAFQKREDPVARS